MSENSQEFLSKFPSFLNFDESDLKIYQRLCSSPNIKIPLKALEQKKPDRLNTYMKVFVVLLLYNYLCFISQARGACAMSITPVFAIPYHWVRHEILEMLLSLPVWSVFSALQTFLIKWMVLWALQYNPKVKETVNEWNITWII